MGSPTNRLYADLAWLWPLWSDPAEYLRYDDFVTDLIRRHCRRDVQTLLNLGCGGGNNIFNLKHDFTVTGVDLSPAMLDHARRLNPECRLISADMRVFRDAERFDAVLIDDAVAYMTTESDLRAVFATAWAHLRGGGVMVCTPDSLKETFVQNTTNVSSAMGSVKPAGIDLTVVENLFDPDPQDTTYEVAFIYLIRREGRLTIEHDFHHLGVFPIDVWRRLLIEIGFERHETDYVESSQEYVTFTCVKGT